jgi:hypothetical protein
LASQEHFGQMCRRVCDENDWELLPSGVRLQLPGGRSQLVSLDIFQGREHEMVRVESAIGPAMTLGAEGMVDALTANADLSHGALAIRGLELVLTDTFLVAEVDAGELEAAIRYLAQTADFYERVLFHKDEY